MTKVYSLPDFLALLQSREGFVGLGRTDIKIHYRFTATHPMTINIISMLLSFIMTTHHYTEEFTFEVEAESDCTGK